MLKHSRSQGFAHAFLVTSLVVALLGALSFIFWQNFIHKESTTTEIVTTTSPKKKIDSNIGYLVLKDWGIKLKIPETKSEIVYYKVDNEDGPNYEFTTKRVEALGDSCVEPSKQGSVARLGVLIRRLTKLDEPYSPNPANNNEPLNGYYYYVAGINAPCAMDSPEIQLEDRNLINDMLRNPVPVEK